MNSIHAQHNNTSSFKRTGPSIGVATGIMFRFDKSKEGANDNWGGEDPASEKNYDNDDDNDAIDGGDKKKGGGMPWWDLGNNNNNKHNNNNNNNNNNNGGNNPPPWSNLKGRLARAFLNFLDEHGDYRSSLEEAAARAAAAEANSLWLRDRLKKRELMMKNIGGRRRRRRTGGGGGRRWR
ncbi:hypothetical protein ACHAXA_002964 [Cyclostephanos tholiformis]|uniref:Uncharacterized protein n=1 Tax=Cyclostephanos tholiformis TaxID=382380 RepID=A0ABD3SBR1_9STRA